MRDALVIPLGKEISLVITSDNSGGIGMKEQDVVKVNYETVGYFSFRVAMMECIAAGAKPKAVILQNFCGDEEWVKLMAGVERGLKELGLDGIQVTGSSESNFPLVQSAVGLNVIGLKSVDEKGESTPKKVALIGMPLVGNEVLNQADEVAPLSLFYQISQLEDVVAWPVGSKGIGQELKRMGLELLEPSTKVNLQKSGGPATSFLVGYPEEQEKKIKKLAECYFHSLI